MGFWNIAAPILMAIFIYSVVGFLFIALGTTIYDNFPTSNFNISGTGNYSVILRNNAPLTLPYINPAFMGYVTVIGDTQKVSCFVDSGKGKLPCDEAIIDLGYIPAGQERNLNIYLEPQGNNFTLNEIAYLNFLQNLQVKSKILKCNTLASNNSTAVYSCR